MTIYIEVTDNEIVGSVGNNIIVKLFRDNKESDWNVGMSSCLPSNITKAEEYVECLRIVFDSLK
jgi:hypothetical protein